MDSKKDVTEFRKAFDLDILVGKGMNVDDHILHHSLIIEELKELAEADNHVDRLDAIVDSVYVLTGQEVHDSSLTGINYFIIILIDLATEMGYDFVSAWNEVHASNMSKLDENGVPIYREDGKVLKGPNFFAPDLRKALWLD